MLAVGGGVEKYEYALFSIKTLTMRLTGGGVHLCAKLGIIKN